VSQADLTTHHGTGVMLQAPLNLDHYSSLHILHVQAACNTGGLKNRHLRMHTATRGVHKGEEYELQSPLTAHQHCYLTCPLLAILSSIAWIFLLASNGGGAESKLGRGLPPAAGSDSGASGSGGAPLRRCRPLFRLRPPGCRGPDDA
jgi:hypothetical protein